MNKIKKGKNGKINKIIKTKKAKQGKVNQETNKNRNQSSVLFLQFRFI